LTSKLPPKRRAPSVAVAELDRLGELHALTQRARVLNRHGTSIDRSVRSKVRWERRFESALKPLLGDVPSDAQLDELIREAQADWKAKGIEKSLVEKGFGDRIRRAVEGLLRFMIGSAQDFKKGAMAVYMSLAADAGEDSGQHTLDSLGINKTWRWTGVRDMPRDLFQVRGSKVLQHAYGNHVEELAKIITDATDPAKPKTVDQVREEIRDRWSKLTRYEAQRIARTETASVWETTTYNAQRANGVEQFTWVVATGPSIGPPNSEAVCKICLSKAAKSPYSGHFDLPPAHPNCRCTLIPSLDHDWLPPAEPWSGDIEPPLPLRRSDTP
jgi:SPP1 gp7 family putative phage head morphogenesis protein